MTAMEREPLLVPDIPPSLYEVGALLVHWAVEGEESRFRLAVAVMCTSLLRKHLPMSDKEQRELCLHVGMYCGLVHSLKYTNKCV
jgi:hypothetical protein